MKVVTPDSKKEESKPKRGKARSAQGSRQDRCAQGQAPGGPEDPGRQAQARD